MLTNEKPSAVYRIEGGSSTSFIIGLSVERLETLDNLEVQKKSMSSFGADKKTTIANPQKMLENLFNYALSFGTKTPMQGQEYVPVKALQNWYDTTMKKLTQDPALFN